MTPRALWATRGSVVRSEKESLLRIATACSLVLAALALPSRDAAAQFAEKKVLTLEIAKKMVAAAESEAARNHLAGVVAVVDDAGG
jgi:glc operon protein GlcG